MLPIQNFKKQERTLIALVLGGHFCSHAFILALPPLFPWMIADLGISYIALGAILSTIAIASSVSQIPIGMLVDRYGPKYFLIGGLALLSLSIMLMGFVESYVPLLILAFTVGMSNAVFHPCDYSILSKGIHEDRLGQAFSMHTFSGYTGWAVTPLTVTFLATVFDWHMALIIVGIAGLFVAFILLVNQHQLEVTPSDVSSKPREKKNNSFSQNLASLISPPLLMLFLFFLFAATSDSGLRGFTPSVLPKIYEVTEITANFTLTLWLTGSMVGVLVGGYLADKYRRFDLIASIGIIVGASILCLVASKLLAVAMLSTGYFIGGFMVGLIAPSRDLAVRSVVPPDKIGQAFGFVSTGLGIGGMCGPIIFGWIMDHSAPERILFTIAIFMGFTLIFALAATRVHLNSPLILTEKTNP